MDPTVVWREWRTTILKWDLSAVKTFELTKFSIKTLYLDFLQLIVPYNAIIAHSILQI
jgi:hypothetical protein